MLIGVFRELIFRPHENTDTKAYFVYCKYLIGLVSAVALSLQCYSMTIVTSLVHCFNLSGLKEAKLSNKGIIKGADKYMKSQVFFITLLELHITLKAQCAFKMASLKIWMSLGFAETFWKAASKRCISEFQITSI